MYPFCCLAYYPGQRGHSEGLFQRNLAIPPSPIRNIIDSVFDWTEVPPKTLAEFSPMGPMKRAPGLMFSRRVLTGVFPQHVFFEEREGMSERVDLCHSVMYALFFECPLFLFADLQINVVVGRCRTLSFDLGILCLSGFLAFKGRSYSLACHRPYYTTVGWLRVSEGDLGADSYR
jgi:hypothetical protein